MAPILKGDSPQPFNNQPYTQNRFPAGRGAAPHPSKTDGSAAAQLITEQGSIFDEGMTMKAGANNISNLNSFKKKKRQKKKRLFLRND